jgi:hypothetical protein
MTVTMQASRTDVEKALALHVDTYAKGDRRFFANDVEPSLPGAIAAHVQAILGLTDLAQPRALNVSQPPAYYQCPEGVDPQYCDLYGPLCAIYAGARSTGELLMDLEGTGKGPRDYVKSYNAHNKYVQEPVSATGRLDRSREGRPRGHWRWSVVARRRWQCTNDRTG